VSVTDPGLGIPADKLDRIFWKFHRLDSEDSRETYGHGLGLYITKGLAEAHGGRIWVESREGHGSTFSFTLPLASSSGSDHNSALKAVGPEAMGE
jgi:signal transduction histidine kinase